MTAALGLLWFLGLVALWAAVSGVFLILKRCMLDPLWDALTETWAKQEWPWWV